MPDFSTRSSSIEIMDDLNCSGPVVDQTLIEIEFINKWLGGNAVTLSGFREVLKHHPKNTSLKIADLGCGGGEMLQVVATDLRSQHRTATLTGIDANPHIVAFAENHAAGFPEITFKTINILSDDFDPTHYDIVLGTLFFHHFTTEQLITTFSKFKKNHRCSLIINDLHRHWLAYYAIKFLTALFSKSDMVKYDAPLSVHRGFTRTELKEILQAAGISNFTLRWKWAFRWQVIILP